MMILLTHNYDNVSNTQKGGEEEEYGKRCSSMGIMCLFVTPLKDLTFRQHQQICK